VQEFNSVIKPYRGILFDMDGTLTSTNQLIFDTFNYVTDKYSNRTYSPEEITKMFGPPEDIAMQRLVAESVYEDAMRDFYLYYRDQHTVKAKLYDGIKDTLQKVYDAGIPLGLFTGKGRTSTEITLKKFDLNKYFRVVITGHDVTRHKPSGEGIHRALQYMNIAPEDALMVGDSVADVRASREAGVDIAVVLWDSFGFDKVIALETQYRFLSIDEFSSWIDKLITYRTNDNETNNEY
jgi:pyrophosphatase PpaX